jgi:hypothetical protein
VRAGQTEERAVSDDDRLAELLLEWEERHERGEDVPAAALCPGRPDLVPELAARIALLRRMAWVTADPPPAPAAEPAPAEELAGRYRLDEVIGEGGHGRVWRGYDLQLQRPVAVKLPRPDEARGDRGSDAFLIEARKVARLSYPGIVPVYDVGRHGGGYFIVSEWIDGTDLGRRLRDGPVPVAEAVRVVAAAARSLHHAHERGFVHRDVKPANILLGRDGRVFVTDFGIAATPDTAAGTEAGAGTLAYMAPERLGGGTGADVRGDVYGLGVVLYELLTGRLPFPGPTPERVREAILTRGPARPRTPGSDPIPPAVERVCLTCLAKNPTDRYPTAGAVADELGRWAADPEHGAAEFGGRPAAVRRLVESGVANGQTRRYEQAVRDFAEAIRLAPDDADVFARLGLIHYQCGEAAAAAAAFADAIRLDPDHTFALNNLAWLLSTSPDDRARDGRRAVPLAARACELTGWVDPVLVSTLAAAHAECGAFGEAVRWARAAIALGISDRRDLDEVRKQLSLYETGEPYRA